jgi:hypothetical protein
MNNPLGFTDSLRANYYHYPALPPVMLWRDSIAPNAPIGLIAKPEVNGVKLMWQTPLMAKDNEPVYGYVIYRFAAGAGDKYQIMPKISCILPITTILCILMLRQRREKRIFM